MNPPALGGIPLDRIAALFDAEKVEYERRHPLSRQKIGHGMAGFYRGVPMHWMLDWPMPFPFLVKEANGAMLRDVDGNEYADFCLGVTGSMFGHSPAPVVDAIRRQAGQGPTCMLPTEDAVVVGRLFSQSYISEVRSAKKVSGDNAYIYQNPNVIRGTIPVGEHKF